MPIQLPQFRQLEMDEVNPSAAGFQQGIQNAGNIFSLAQKAMQFPGELQKQKLGNEQSKILNQLKQLELQNAPEMNQLAKALKQAQLQRAQQMAENPLLGQPGIVGQLGAELYANQHNLGGTNPQQQQKQQQQQGGPQVQQGSNQNGSGFGNYGNLIHQQIAANLQKARIDNDLKVAQTKGYPWAHLTAETKNGLTAQALGMGIDPIQLQKYINEGKDLKQMAEAEGLDPEHLPPPIYQPTTTTKSRAQQQEQVGAELDFLGSVTSQALKPYANTFMGKSPAALVDQFSSDPKTKKQFGRYIGALALQSELANGRVLLAGGRSGIEIVRDLKDKTLAGIHQISPIRLTPEAFEEAQRFIDQTLQKGARIRRTTGMSPYSRQNVMQPNEQQGVSDNLATKKVIGGKTYVKRADGWYQE